MGFKEDLEEINQLSADVAQLQSLIGLPNVAPNNVEEGRHPVTQALTSFWQNKIDTKRARIKAIVQTWV